MRLEFGGLFERGIGLPDKPGAGRCELVTRTVTDDHGWSDSQRISPRFFCAVAIVRHFGCSIAAVSLQDVTSVTFELCIVVPSQSPLFTRVMSCSCAGQRIGVQFGLLDAGCWHWYFVAEECQSLVLQVHQVHSCWHSCRFRWCLTN